MGFAPRYPHRTRNIPSGIPNIPGPNANSSHKGHIILQGESNMKTTIVCLGVLLVSLCAVNLAAYQLFEAPVQYEASNDPRSVFAEDLNGDGYTDIAVSNGGYPYVVSILINNGDGTFAEKTDYAILNVSRSLYAIDLDGDDDKDLAVTDAGYNYVSILKNKGDGTFDARVDYSVGDDPWKVVAADFDGDDDNDLAVVDYYSDNVSVLMNNGDGTFADTVNYAAGDGPISLNACDYDGDEDIDLAVTNLADRSVMIYLNNGDGTFASAVIYGTGGLFPYGLFSADLDGDNDCDLAVGCSYQNSVLIFFNNGDGTFIYGDIYGVGDMPNSIFASDIDSDGDIDVVTGNTDSDNISYLANNGDGTFATAVNYDAGTSPYSVFAADFDNDTIMDLVVTNQNVDSVSILIGMPPGYNPNDQWPTYAHDFGRTSQSGIIFGDISGITRQWSYNPGNSQLINFTSPVIANDIVYVSYDQGLHAIDLLTGDPLWDTQTHGAYSNIIYGALRSEPTVDVANNRIYFGTGNMCGFVCANATTGDTIWARGVIIDPLPGSPGNTRWAHSVIIGDAIYFGNEGGQIYALDKNTGADLYNIQLDANVYTSPSYGLVDTGGASIDMLFWGTDNGSIYGIEPTGSGFNEVWQYVNPNQATLDAIFYSCPTFYNGNLLGHAAINNSSANDGYDGFRINLNPSDGSEIYSDYHLGLAMYSAPAVFGNVAYYAADARTGIPDGSGITAVDIATNSILWNYNGDGSDIDQIPTHSSVSFDPYLFFGTRDGRWKILNGINGDLEVEYNLGGNASFNLVYSTALAHGSDGKDYVVVATRLNPESYAGAVYAFSVDNTSPRPRMVVPQSVIRAGTTANPGMPPFQRTLAEVITNYGTADLTYTATLTDGAAAAAVPANDKSILEIKAAMSISNTDVIDPDKNPEEIEDYPDGQSTGFGSQMAAEFAPPTWVSWVDPYSPNETVSGVIAPGESVSFTFEIDPGGLTLGDNPFQVDIGTNDPDYCPWLDIQPEVQTGITFIEAVLQYDTIETACTKLCVGRTGNYGAYKTGASNYGLDYSLTGDCDIFAAPYLFTGSPVICYENDAMEVVANHSWFDDESFYGVFDKNPAAFTVTTSECDRFESGTFVTQDSALAVEKIWWAPKQADSCTFVIQRLRLYSFDGETQDGLRIGETIDWDIPSDAGADNTGGYDESRRLIYQQGIESNGSGCQPNDARFGGMAFLGFYINDSCTVDTLVSPYGAHVADNEILTYPSNPQNFVPEEIDSLMQIPGYNLMATERDLITVMTFFNDYTLAAGDTLDIYLALSTVQNGTVATLLENVDKAAQWLNDHVKRSCIISAVCGDANGDGQVNVGDAVYLISYVFKGGPAPDPVCAGDANGDGQCNVGDAVYLIAYVFKGGPAPVEGCCL